MEQIRALLRNGARAPLAPKHIRLPGIAAEALSDTEWALLHLLWSGEDVPSEQIADLLWHKTAKESGLPVYIHHLRKKVERDGKRRLLSLRGKGYRLLTQDIEKAD